jgi:uncharacterized protein YhfF
MTAKIEEYWRSYVASLPKSRGAPAGFVAEAFGDTPELIDRLAGLIASGVKTATCSALWEWEAEGARPPDAGRHVIVLDSRGEPVCIVETTGVEIRPFDAVDEGFAAAEGEDDRTLASWREGHLRFFTRSLAKIARAPAPEMPLVCERFRLVYPPRGET